MSSPSWNRRPDLGIGVGLRAPHVQHILTHHPRVDWFEIIAENYMVDGGSARRQLDRILERYPVVQHGVGLYVGSAQGIDTEHLARVQRLARRTRTPWVTDHLCWGSVDGAYSHDLLPLPYTREAVRRTVENVRRVAARLEVPFALENVSSYAEFHASEMTEWQFLGEVLERADVGLLLDVNNIYVSSVNHGFDPFTYLEGLPLHRAVQIHIAGHAAYQRFVIDTHDHPVIDPVWRLYQRAIELVGPVPTLLEWDARIPSFAELCAEARKAERYLHPEQRLAQAG
jgi:uncharacterized protein (UPF0276 family)